MSLIEQAAKRLEELKRAGVPAPTSREETSLSDMQAESAIAPQRSGPAHRDGTELSNSRSGQQPMFVANAAQKADSSMASSRRVAIDLTQLAAKNIVTPNDPRSRVADEFRVLKRPLLGNAKDKRAASIENGNLIM